MRSRWLAAAALLAITAAAAMALEDAVLGDVLGARRGGWLGFVFQQGPSIALWAAAICAVRPFVAWRPRVPRLDLPAIRRWLTRGIPILDARAVAAFRIIFGIALLAVLSQHPIDERGIRLGTQAALAAFIAGLFTRPAIIAVGAGVFFWMLAWTRHVGSHPVATLVVALPLLCAARWSDAWSVDAWLRPRPPRPASAAYGYAVWAPTLVIGVALLAAAVAKLTTGGWIANGTVKFAFVADYHRASVPWGLFIASHPPLAVAASAAAVATEAAAILAVFLRSWRLRLAMGVVIALLFAGFFLLQGELWWGWWVLFLGYLPWELLSRGTPAAERIRLAWPQRIAITALLVLQAIASALRLEVRPAISAFDMYSTTFASTEAFDRANPILERRVEAESGGRWVDVTDCADPLVRDVAPPRDVVETLRPTLAACSVSPDAVRQLRLLESHRRFDWDRGTFEWAYRDRERWMVTVEP